MPCICCVVLSMAALHEHWAALLSSSSSDAGTRKLESLDTLLSPSELVLLPAFDGPSLLSLKLGSLPPFSLADDEEDREREYLPKNHEALRKVPGYERFVKERFELVSRSLRNEFGSEL